MLMIKAKVIFELQNKSNILIEIPFKMVMLIRIYLYLKRKVQMAKMKENVNLHVNLFLTILKDKKRKGLDVYGLKFMKAYQVLTQFCSA